MHTALRTLTVPLLLGVATFGLGCSNLPVRNKRTMPPRSAWQQTGYAKPTSYPNLESGEPSSWRDLPGYPLRESAFSFPASPPPNPGVSNAQWRPIFPLVAQSWSPPVPVSTTRTRSAPRLPAAKSPYSPPRPKPATTSRKQSTAPSSPAALAASPGRNAYTIQKGDTLWKISQRFNTTVNALKLSNHLQSDLIVPGQVLALPDQASGAIALLQPIAAPRGFSASPPARALSAAPATARPYTTLKMPAAHASSQAYTVAQGDTLWKISRQYRTTIIALKQLNQLNSDTIYPGQQLRVQ